MAMALILTKAIVYVNNHSTKNHDIQKSSLFRQQGTGIQELKNH